MTMLSTAEQALSEIGIGPDYLTKEQLDQLETDGYFKVPGYLSADQLGELREAFEKCERDPLVREDLSIEPGTSVFLVDLFNKSSAFDQCLRIGPTLAAAHHLMGEIKVHSLHGRNPSKGRGHQALHSDVPRLTPRDWRLVNTMILLDDVSEENGATRVVPGSHHLPALNAANGDGGVARPLYTEEELALLPEDALATHPREVKLTGKAGTICVINGSIWHGGTLNRSGNPRRLLHMAISRRDVQFQPEHMTHLTRKLLERADPAMRYLLDLDGAEATVGDHADTTAD